MNERTLTARQVGILVAKTINTAGRKDDAEMLAAGFQAHELGRSGDLLGALRIIKPFVTEIARGER